MTKVLFVCLGNICRSPSAEGALWRAVRKAHREADFFVDSAGTGTWHIGEAPDPRAQKAALAAGFDISGHRARLVSPDDFARFDWILACDRENFHNLERMRPENAHAKLVMAMEFAGAPQASIPDPYDGGDEGFRFVITQCEKVAAGIVARL